MRLFDLGGDGSELVSNRILTVPNLLSFARLLILPWVFVEVANGRFARGLAVGFFFGATDFVDGYVARRFDQVTRLGQILDPLSDRLFIGTIAIAMVVSNLLGWWPVALVIGRDAVLLVASLVMLGRGARPPAVTRMGKTATFGLMWSFVPLLAAGIVGSAEEPEPVLFVIGMVVLLASVALYLVVAVDYARQLRAARAAVGD